MKSLTLSLIALVATVSVAHAQPGTVGGGGGSGVNAEIQRATQEFIQLVASHPANFQGVDLRLLNQPFEILNTAKPITTCDGYPLEAFSLV